MRAQAASPLRVSHQEKDDLAFERIVNKPKRSIGDSSLKKINDYARIKDLSLFDASQEILKENILKPVKEFRAQVAVQEHPGQLTRACVELAKNWRTDKYLRRLEATMIVADKHHMFQITGNGDVLEPSNGIIGIGSGGSYALAASKALVDVEGLSAMDIAKKAMDIAANTCVYTNDKFQILTLDSDASAEEEGGEKEKKEVDDGGEKGGEGKKAA